LVSADTPQTSRDRWRRRGGRVSHELARFRSLLIAGALAGATAVALVAWHDGPRSLLTPGPLARPHRELACVSCHAAVETTSFATDSAHCGSCHEEEASLRPAHSALFDENRLTCTDCHGIHRGDRGVAFEADGRSSWFGNGSERATSPTAPAAASFVPLLSASACARCHDTGASADPAAHCFTSAAHGELLALCFDEHRRPAHASPRRLAERDASVEKTRAIVLSRRSAPAWLGLAAATRGFGYVVPGLALAAVLFAWSRRRRRDGARTARRLPVLPVGERRLPRIDPARCLGCHACADACPYDVLEIRRYVAIVARPQDCCGVGPCLERCPNGSLTLSHAGVRSGTPELSATLESRARANLFLAGDVTGGSLIRNALRQGTLVAEAVAARVTASVAGRPASPGVDLLVVGAGPAGLAAALTAKQLGISVEVLEQASVAESIQRFSRHKLVLDAGDAGDEGDEGLPLWIGNAPKEQLLKRWLQRVRTLRLRIRERVRFVRLETGAPAGFLVHAEGADGQPLVFQARHVLLAVGARGTPRPLAVPIPAAAVDRVHYDLSDARGFAGQRVIVLGLGDVAMESAIALAEQQDCEVTVVHRGPGFRRGKQRNIEALSRLSARGRVKLLFDAHITGLTETHVRVELASGVRVLPYDALFVHIGALPARSLLESAGICSRAPGSVAKPDGSRSS
jgi:thioredoxin reductase/NAD-dependent dihydropyrimidine dehydrogenase PreA subunit